MVEIGAKNPDEQIILFAKTHGTGIGVSKEILDLYGVADEEYTSEEENESSIDLSAWYFNPTNEHITILHQIESMFGSKMKRIK